MSGAAALSPDVAAFIQMVGFNCYEGYGLTKDFAAGVRQRLVQVRANSTPSARLPTA